MCLPRCPGADGTLNSWDINTTPLERSAASAASAGDEARWSEVLGDPELLREMRDYFIYAQIKTQGEDALEPRAVPGEETTQQPAAPRDTYPAA